jgi:ribose transport system substrate-binding protein
VERAHKLGRGVLCVAALLGAAGAAIVAAHAATNLGAATANVDRYRDAPVFQAPGPAFDAGKARGKSIFIVPALPEAGVLPSVSAMVAGIRQGAKAVGVKTLSCANGGSTADWTACFRTAIAKKVNAIVLAGGTPPTAVAAQVAAATKAGIKVLAGHVPNPSDPGFDGAPSEQYAASEAGLTAIVPAPYAEAARLLADGVVADRPTPAGRFVIVGSSDVPMSSGMVNVVRDEIAAVCGSDCPVATIDVPYANAGAAIAAAKAATLTTSTVTFVAVVDKLGSLVAEGIREARVVNPSATNSRMHGFGGTPFFIQMGQDNQRVEGAVAENMNWLGWATMDQTLRVLTGHAPLASEKTGLRFVDDGSWGAEDQGLYGFGFPPTLDAGWGDPRSDDGWVTGYRKLWGLPADSTGPAVLPGGGGGGDD